MYHFNFSFSSASPREHIIHVTRWQRLRWRLGSWRLNAAL